MTQFILPGPALQVTVDSDKDDLDIGGATLVDLNLDADWTITGIEADVHGNGVAEGRWVVLRNPTAFTASLPGQDAGSLAVNQFGWTGTKTIAPGEAGLIFRYEAGDLWMGPIGATVATAPFDDGTAIVKGSGDPTKLGRFEVDTNVPTTVTVTLGFPSQNGTIATRELAETFTNKTLTSPAINTPVIAGGTIAGAAVITDGSFQGFKDTNGNELVQLAHVASAVNYPLLSSSATGNAVIIKPGSGGDANVDLTISGNGTGVANVGISGATRAFAGKAGSNPGTTSEGADHYRTDQDYGFSYELTRGKWLGTEFPVYFGHSSSDQPAGTRLRTVGLGSDTDSVYELPFAYTIVAYSYARADSDSSTFEVMVNASTVALTISSSATRGSATNTDVDLAAGDELWARIGSGAANAMSPRTLTLWLRRKAT